MKGLRAATLSVGTELTDGQIIDRNSAWISQRLVAQGIEVVEHRAVPDEHEAIRRALRELATKVDLLFVTGGLGPTSDDFTRDLVAEVFERPLVFDEASLKHIEARLLSRGVPVRTAQRQQCYFPEGAEVLFNSMGTANAFTFKQDGGPTVFVLPGPPVEIAAIWDSAIAARLAGVVPEEERERLHLFRCLGRGESEFADMTEKIMKDQPVRLGYRMHVPYVEVKVWVQNRRASEVQPVLERLEQELRPWIINRDHEDLAGDLLSWVKRSGQELRIFDSSTRGVLGERLAGKALEDKLTDQDLPLAIETSFAAPAEPRAWIEARLSTDGPAAIIALAPDLADGVLRVGVRIGERTDIRELTPMFKAKVQSERARKYFAEVALHLFHGLSTGVEPGA